MQTLQALREQVTAADDLPPMVQGRLLALIAQAEQNTPADADTPKTSPGTLSSTMTELEAAHPEATAFLNRFAITLGNMGI